MPTAQQKMKLYQIAQKAIDEQDTRMAFNLVHYLNTRYHLNSEGVREYLELHGVDWREFEQLLEES